MKQTTRWFSFGFSEAVGPHDMAHAVESNGVIGAGEGSFFLFRSSYKAFLISYVDDTKKKQLADASRATTSRKWGSVFY